MPYGVPGSYPAVPGTGTATTGTGNRYFGNTTWYHLGYYPVGWGCRGEAGGRRAPQNNNGVVCCGRFKLRRARRLRKIRSGPRTTPAARRAPAPDWVIYKARVFWVVECGMWNVVGMGARVLSSAGGYRTGSLDGIERIKHRWHEFVWMMEPRNHPKTGIHMHHADQPPNPSLLEQPRVGTSELSW